MEERSAARLHASHLGSWGVGVVENVLLNNNAPPGWVAMSTLCILVHDVQKKMDEIPILDGSS